MSNACQEPKPLKQSASLPSPPKLLDRLRQVMRLKHYSYRTEQPMWIGSAALSSSTANATPRK
jgi:hypothetical protein